MVRDVRARLTDIHEAATDLLDFVHDMETEAFHALPHADRMGFRVVKNALIELGEAVRTMPEEVRMRYSEGDWKGFAGLRDLIAHRHFGIDTTRLLPIIRTEVPGVRAAVERELGVVPPAADAGR